MKSELTKAHNYSLLERKYLNYFSAFLRFLSSAAGYLSQHSPHTHQQSAASLTLSNQTLVTRIC